MSWWDLLSVNSDSLNKLIERTVLGNPVWLWAAAVIGMFVCYLALRAFKKFTVLFISNQKLPVAWHQPLVQVLGRTKTYFLFTLAVFVGLQFLELSPKLDKVSLNSFKFVFFLQLGLWLDRCVTLLIRHTFVSKSTDDPQFKSEAELNSPRTVILSFMARLLIVATALLMFLDNLGVNITALVTGLGVGGVAVALAVQNVLGDLFASLAIALDKPFEIGDVICVSPHTGTVEKVGLKTTRIRLTSGEQLVVGNQEILRNRIQNFKRLQERRILFDLSVSVKTSRTQIESLLTQGHKILLDNGSVRFERSWAKGIAAGAVQLEWVYTVLSPDFVTYANVQQALTLGLLEHCNSSKIEIAGAEKSSEGD